MRYTDEYRASAVLILEANGYPETKGALTKTASYLHINHTTLLRWFTKEKNPPPLQLAQSKKIDFVQLIEDEIAAILGEMKDAIHDADYRELGTVFGILMDKRQLLTGGSTENIHIKGLIVNLKPDDG